jgi:hypothetical protein
MANRSETPTAPKNDKCYNTNHASFIKTCVLIMLHYYFHNAKIYYPVNILHKDIC